MLGDHPLEAGPRVPQAAGEGGRRQAQDDAVQVVLSGGGQRPQGQPRGSLGGQRKLQLVEFSHKKIDGERSHLIEEATQVRVPP